MAATFKPLFQNNTTIVTPNYLIELLEILCPRSSGGIDLEMMQLSIKYGIAIKNIGQELK